MKKTKILLPFVVMVLVALLGLSSCNREQSCESDQVGVLEVLEKPYKLSGEYTIKAKFHPTQQNFYEEDDLCLEIYGKIPKDYVKPGYYQVAVKLIPKNICGSYHPCISYIYKIGCIKNIK
jgi:hypothetical protein